MSSSDSRASRSKNSAFCLGSKGANAFAEFGRLLAEHVVHVGQQLLECFAVQLQRFAAEIVAVCPRGAPLLLGAPRSPEGKSRLNET
jgi:hypothetical protein